ALLGRADHADGLRPGREQPGHHGGAGRAEVVELSRRTGGELRNDERGVRADPRGEERHGSTVTGRRCLPPAGRQDTVGSRSAPGARRGGGPTCENAGSTTHCALAETPGDARMAPETRGWARNDQRLDGLWSGG